MAELDKVERVKAEDFLQKAQEAASQQWQARGMASRAGVVGPNPDLTYDNHGPHPSEAQVPL